MLNTGNERSLSTALICDLLVKAESTARHELSALFVLPAWLFFKLRSRRTVLNWSNRCLYCFARGAKRNSMTSLYVYVWSPRSKYGRRQGLKSTWRWLKWVVCSLSLPLRKCWPSFPTTCFREGERRRHNSSCLEPRKPRTAGKISNDCSF